MAVTLTLTEEARDFLDQVRETFRHLNFNAARRIGTISGKDTAATFRKASEQAETIIVKLTGKKGKGDTFAEAEGFRNRQEAQAAIGELLDGLQEGFAAGPVPAIISRSWRKIRSEDVTRDLETFDASRANVFDEIHAKAAELGLKITVGKNNKSPGVAI